MKKILKPLIHFVAFILAYSGITKLLPRRLSFPIVVRIPEKFRVSDTIIRFRGIKLKVNKDDSIGRLLRFMDTYKPVHTGFFESLVVGKKLFFDFGAHIGMYSNLAAKHGVRAVAFEPDPSLCQNYIRTSLSLNHATHLVTVLSEAVSDKKGTTTFWLHRFGNSGAGRLFKAEDMGENPTIIVPTDTLDSFVRQHGKPDLIKVHIEGAEALLILGSQEIFQGESAPTLIIEFHLPDITALVPGMTADKLISKLKSCGYSVRTLTEPKYKESMWHIFYKGSLPPSVLQYFTPETQVPGGYYLK